MDQDTNTIIKTYLSKLPVAVRDVILSDEWEKRIDEIAKKYSLNESQISSLSYEIIFSVLGIESEEDLLINLKNELNISNILSEQITEEVKQRIFSWIDKVFETKNRKTDSQFEINNQIPEIRHENIPMVERSIPQYIHTNSVPNYAPKPKVVVDSEPVQTPVAVPRFKAVPLSEGEVGQDFIPKIQPKPNAGGIMETKLNKVVSETTSTPPQVAPAKKYTVDPYREPIS